ncbi:hypothetical protein, partial [uncultured Dialister sp.]|uniref:hypothetical protein n=1 Tax=uncultured Dialister sp. TaxID=278064 RepID=UPI0025E27D2E
ALHKNPRMKSDSDLISASLEIRNEEWWCGASNDMAPRVCTDLLILMDRITPAGVSRFQLLASGKAQRPAA